MTAARYPAVFIDSNNETRLEGFISFTDSANQPGLPSQWTVDAQGNLLITSDSTVADYASMFRLVNGDGQEVVNFYSAGEFDLQIRDNDTGGLSVITNGHTGTQVVADNQFIAHNSGVGFFGTTPAARQTLHSGTATPEQIALALEASTLMTGD